MHTDLLQNVGLAKNEARIYETLLELGESTVGQIAARSKVHRRNTYDSLRRLIEKGLVFEIIQTTENHYSAVEPHKLLEALDEKRLSLTKVLPDLEKLYTGVPRIQAVYIYRGTEGWKNYIRDIIRIGKDVFAIGAKAPLNNPRLRGTLELLRKDIESRKIRFYNLYDAAVKGTKHVGFLNESYRFLPKNYDTRCTIAIMADRIVVFSGVTVGNYDENTSFTVIVNQEIAEAYRSWFQFMWNKCSK